MSQTRPITWFADEPKPNKFFFRSPFRSWEFALNTVLAGGLFIAYASSLWKHWDQIGQGLSRVNLLVFTLPTIVYPYWSVLREHARIRESYLSGQITEQPSDSPIDQLLKLADNSLNTRLFVWLLCYGFFFFGFVLPRLQHLR